MYCKVKNLTNIHNSLDGLQGGQEGEYYHLTEEQYNNIDNIELTDEKVQITENTNFGQIGDNQKDFNRNVSDYKVIVDSKNIEQDERIENLEGINYTWSPTNRTLTLFDRGGNQLSQVSLVSLDNEGTDIRYNASTLSLELYNADNELLDSIPVSSFIGSVGTQLQLNSNQLQLKDSQGNILSTVSFTVSNIQGLQTALDGKLDKGGYTGTAQDLYTHIDGKIEAGYNYIPKVGNGASGKVLVYSAVSEIYGKVGINLPGEASERFEVGGNIKADNLKAKSTQFQLQSSINPTPNTLVPKTDGSGLIWYNNSSVGSDLVSYISPTNNYVGRWNNGTFVNGSIQDDGSKIGIGGAVDTNSSPARVRISHLNNKFFSGLYTDNMGTPSSIDFGDVYGSAGDLFIKTNRQSNGATMAKKGALQFSKLTGLQNDYKAFSNHVTHFPTFVNFNNFFQYESHLAFSEYLYNQTILNRYRTLCGGDASTGLNLETSGVVREDMWAGALFTVKDAQFYIDLKGQFFVRGNPSSLGADGAWKILVSEKQNTTTNLSEKLALARVKLKSYTKAERGSLTNKEVGEMIWQTDSGNSGIRVFDGTNWLAIQTIID